MSAGAARAKDMPALRWCRGTAFLGLCQLASLFVQQPRPATAARANDPAGHSSCRCIDPTAPALMLYHSRCDPRHRALPGGGCYPASYGARTCAAHDANLTTECVADGAGASCQLLSGEEVDCSGSTNAWCGARWCYVDPTACSLRNDQTGFFPHTAYTDAQGVNRSLHYSYETCGNLNSYDTSKFQKKLEAQDRLRISFPGASGSGYTIRRNGGYSGFSVNNGTRREMSNSGRHGSVVDFFDTMMKDYGITRFEVVEVSAASAAKFPESSFSACVHEVALGTTDVCIGNFWPTLERRLMASFTTGIYQDNFHMITKKFIKEPGSFKIEYFFAFFSVWPAQSWIAIGGMLLYASVAMWVIEGATNDDDFPEMSIADGLRRSAFYQFQSLLGGGDFRNSPHTGEGKFVIMAVSYSILVILTVFTAEMTTIKIRADTVWTINLLTPPFFLPCRY